MLTTIPHRDHSYSWAESWSCPWASVVCEAPRVPQGRSLCVARLRHTPLLLPQSSLQDGMGGYRTRPSGHAAHKSGTVK